MTGRLAVLAGLALGTLSWGVHTEAGTFLPGLYCAAAPAWGVVLAAALLLLALGGALMSWRSGGEGALRFSAKLSVLVALLLSLPLLLQLLAVLLVDACAR